MEVMWYIRGEESIVIQIFFFNDKIDSLCTCCVHREDRTVCTPYIPYNIQNIQNIDNITKKAPLYSQFHALFGNSFYFDFSIKKMKYGL